MEPESEVDLNWITLLAASISYMLQHIEFYLIDYIIKSIKLNQ